MACERWIDAISAIADGEDPGVDERLLDAHVDRCASCRAFRDRVDQTRAALRLQRAPRMPDLSRRIVKLNALADRASRWGMVRGLLAVVAVEILILSVPALILGQQVANSSEHAARHLGAFTAAYGAGLLVVVARPARARTMLPVAATLALALLITAVVDVVDGRAPLLGETLHLPELFSVLLLWLLASPADRRPASSEGRRSDLPARLRVVESPDAGETEAL